MWIGHSVSIFKGTEIHDGSMIGTKSLLSGASIPERCVAAGVPARVIRENILWTREDPYAEDDVYVAPENTPQAIGFERLTKINEIEPKVSAKEKVKLIEKILKE